MIHHSLVLRVCMSTALAIALAVLVMPPESAAISGRAGKKETVMQKKSVLDFTMTNIDGKQQPLSAYRGKVLMIINTASECGFTPQYETLEKLYETYKDRGFCVLAFPSNDFGKQEPGTDSEIKNFCSTKYHTTFDLFSKIDVMGKDQDALYRYITKDSPFPGDIKWNFQKYLVDRSGKLVAKFMSPVDPMSKDVRDEVERLLNEKSSRGTR